VRGTTLVFDTETKVDGDEAEITRRDIARLLALLQANPEIAVLELNSSGGSIYAGDEMARIVLDFELDTAVSGQCSSSCVNIFLGGKVRRMYLGSKIGFHQRFWAPKAIKRFYESNRESEGWASVYDFAAWNYKDTQTEVYDDLAYMVRRGVEPGFAIKTKRAQFSGLWFPGRLELINAGVLRE